ncbi:MAG: hypothetical protein U5K38_08425 [Woeseiaceae bacterium]|nr:hypothetical protein [Woeseiaceae bacterium]
MTHSRKDAAVDAGSLRSQLNRLESEARRNMRILRTSQQRELALLNAESIAGLLQVMLVYLKDSYRLDQVSVVLADPDHDIRHLLMAGGSTEAEFRRLDFRGLTGWPRASIRRVTAALARQLRAVRPCTDHAR